MDEERLNECKSGNVVECVVHSNNEQEGDKSTDSDTDSTDYDKEIDNLFNLDELFGEKNKEAGKGREDIEEDEEGAQKKY